MTWRIDALDVRGGVAFAAERDADLLGDAESWALDPAVPSIVLIAPGFEPEPTPSRGIGLAATRGAFQLGLFVDGEEVAFATLADLQEFVRRSYLRSSGGSGGAGGGAPLPRRPGGEGGEGGGEPDRPLAPSPESAAAQVVAWGRRFGEAVAGLAMGEPGRPMREDRAGFSQRSEAADSRDGAFRRGLEQLFWELLARTPASLSGPDGDAWIRSAGALGTLIASLDMGWALRDAIGDRPDAEPPPVKRALDAIDQFLGIGRTAPGRRTDRLLAFLFVAGSPRLHPEVRSMVSHGHWPPHWWDRHAWWTEEDLLSVFERTPLPTSAQDLLDGAVIPAEQRNLLHLLNAALASPQTLTRDPSAAELLLVAAGALVSGSVRLEGGAVAIAPKPTFAERVLQAAGDWLHDAFPERALAGPLEAIIEKDALRAQYADDENPEAGPKLAEA